MVAVHPADKPPVVFDIGTAFTKECYQKLTNKNHLKRELAKKQVTPEGDGANYVSDVDEPPEKRKKLSPSAVSRRSRREVNLTTIMPRLCVVCGTGKRSKREKRGCSWVYDNLVQTEKLDSVNKESGTQSKGDSKSYAKFCETVICRVIGEDDIVSVSHLYEQYKASKKKHGENDISLAGYSGDDVPICIIPSVLREVGSEKWLRDIKDEAELHATLRTFLRNIYLKQLLISMGERPVIICESLLCTDLWKQTLAKVLLQDFGVPSAVFAPRHLLSLYTLGISTGLVLHSGYSEALVLPIYENMVLLNAWQSLPIGGQAVECNLEKLISETGQVVVSGQQKSLQDSDIKLTQKQLEDIKVRTCFVTRHDRAKTLREASQAEESSTVQTPDPPHDVQYPLTGDTTLTIPGRVRETACEVMYDYNNTEQTLAHLVLDSILQCPVDTRRKLAENIVIIGGNAMLPGFTHRLQQELKELSLEQKYSKAMSLNKFAFHKLNVKENFTAWLGGSLLGSCGNLDSYSITKSQYQSSGGKVPDWSTYNPEINSQPHNTL